jgi:hypothetical protein
VTFYLTGNIHQSVSLANGTDVFVNQGLNVLAVLIVEPSELNIALLSMGTHLITFAASMWFCGIFCLEPKPI